MNEESGAEVTGKQAKEYEPGTVLPVADDPLAYYVLGNSGWWYLTRLASESEPARCECPHRTFRGAFCHHLQAAQRYHDGGWPTAAEEIAEWKRQKSARERRRSSAVPSGAASDPTATG